MGFKVGQKVKVNKDLGWRDSTLVNKSGIYEIVHIDDQNGLVLICYGVRFSWVDFFIFGGDY